MKILRADDIRRWDQYTIQHEPVTSLQLMERAAQRCADWIDQQIISSSYFHIFCGKGNNGGDGLAIARLLAQRGRPVTVHILEFGHKGTDDFQANLARLHQFPSIAIRFIQDETHFPDYQATDTIIDALFGSGLNRGLEGITAGLVESINHSPCQVIAIDIPSGLFADRSSGAHPVIQAKHTLTFQCFKPAFLFSENERFTGEIHILDIGLHPAFLPTVFTPYELTDIAIAQSIYRPRKPFSHKGTYGHALLVAGSYGKIGAALLAAGSCLRSGVGLLTCHIPGCGYDAMQTAVPEAMVLTDFNSSFITRIEEDLTRFDAIGIGPGLGTASETKILLRETFDAYRSPMVIDADALNIIASQKDLLHLVPAGSILTPHPKEFERLFGQAANEFDRVGIALQKATELNCVIVLKGHHTLVATPDGKGFFNNTGNAGMATGGTGDVLTGILTGLLAQDYSSVEAAILGVYLHGLAGDIAATETSEEALIAGDITSHLGKAYRQVSSF